MPSTVLIYCATCHGCGAKVIVSIPELRALAPLQRDAMKRQPGRGKCPVCGVVPPWRMVAQAVRREGKS